MDDMEKMKIVLVLGLVILFLIIFLLLNLLRSENKISSFRECAQAGYPVSENDPRQCVTPGGGIFFESLLESQQKIYCPLKNQDSQFCTKEYMPVCGWFDQSIKCIKYPCAQVFSNECEACLKEDIEYYTVGECPSIDSVTNF